MKPLHRLLLILLNGKSNTATLARFREGRVFPFSLILVGLFLLVGCGNANESISADMRLTELEAKYQTLQERYAQARTRLEEIEADPANANTLEPVVIMEPVTFANQGNTLQLVRDRNALRCGGNADLPGFGFLDSELGEFVGFDVDFCRAIAIAIFGEHGTENLDMIPLTGRTRFTALQSGEIDVLIRNTTWTLSRDSTLGLDFAPITFYDGQGMMVRSDSEIRKLTDLAGEAVCVTGNTTSEKTIIQYYQNQALDVEIKPFNDIISLRQAYDKGVCAGMTADKSGLIGQQSLLEEPGEHQILLEDISREPLGPVVRHGDDNWLDIVTWTTQCMLNAEWLGINQSNVAELLADETLEIQRLLGQTDELGQALGLRNDFCYHIIDQVGNYADLYNRHLGPDTAFNLPRGLNALFTDGGLLYPIPFK